jgi:hypothetical protein
MKSITRIAIPLFALCLFFGLSACTEEVEYTPAKAVTNAQVYFPNTLNSKVSLSQDLDVTSYNVELRRIDKTDELSVGLTLETDAPDIFTIPTSATFAAGADVTNITLTYDPNQLEYDDFKSVSIAVSDQSLTTPYGTSTYAFTAGIPAPWETLGEATFMDSFVFGNEYKIELQRHMLDPTRYRLVDPYSQGLAEEGYVPDYNKGNQSPFLEFQVLPSGSVYKGVTTTVNGLVVYPDFNTGYFRSDYDDDIYCYHPSRFTSMSTENSWLHNIVTQFSSAGGEPEIVQLAPFYYIPNAGAGWNYTQSDGVITIIFPGVVLADYSVEIEYTGRFTDTSDNDYAVADVKLGADVAYAKVALVPGELTQATLDGVLDGSIESEQITASGSVKFPLTVSGPYTYIAISYTNDDEPTDFDYTVFDYSKTVASHAIEDFYGSYTLAGISQSDGETIATMDVTISAGVSDTLIITGIDYAREVKATFNSSTSMISIVPQILDDYVANDGTVHDMTLFTTTPEGETSTTDAMKFTLEDSGNIVMSRNSAADGYLIGSNSIGGWVDGYFDLTFEVRPTAAPAKSKSVKVPVGKKLAQRSIIESTDHSPKTFTLQGKVFFPVKAKTNKSAPSLP